MTKDEAIYLLRNTAWLAPSGTLEPVEEAVNMAVEALKERPKGKWRYRIIGDNVRRVCNCCEWEQSCDYPWYMGHHYLYCPHCGADMGGEEE